MSKAIDYHLNLVASNTSLDFGDLFKQEEEEHDD